MELRQLRYFLAVADECSFSAAARRIHIAQPALTRQIRALEADLGVTLFQRVARGVRLTPAGESFHRETQQILQTLSLARRKAQMIDKGQLGELTLGVTPMHLWIPELTRFLKSFRSAYPQVMLRMNTLLSGPQVNALQRGELDIGLLFFPPEDPLLGRMPLYVDKLVLVTQSDSPMAITPPRRLAEIGDAGFIWFDRDRSANYHDRLIGHFQQRGFTPNVIQKGSDNATMLALVASGIGCTIVPRMAVGERIPGVTIIELDDLNLPLPLEMIWRHDHITPPVNNMIEIAREHSFDGLS